ncbi:MAG: hypothetical protein RL030_1851, partial [Pseudomonadota bacterium]
QLAPFALEDQLSEDIDALHFAVGPRDGKDGPVPVLVVSRALLESWIARAREFGLEPQVVHADSDLLQAIPGHVAALLDASQLTLRAEGGRPVVLSVDDPALALEMLLGPEADLSTVHLTVQATPLGWQRHAGVFEQLRARLASLKVQIATGGLLALLAPGIAQIESVNLLQGDLRPRQDHSGTLRRWRLVAGLAAALLVLHVASLLWELRQLRRSQAGLDQSIEQAAAIALPGEPLGGNLRRRVEERAGVVASGGGQQGDFLHLLAAIAAAHDNVPVTKIGALSFKPGELEMKVSGPDAASLEMLNQALRAGGYQAEVASGSTSGAAFEGRILMRTQGS